jgi:hypothetical protein
VGAKYKFIESRRDRLRQKETGMKTIDEFLEALKATPRTWRVNGRDGAEGLPFCIRCGSGQTYQCPLSAIMGKVGVAQPLDLGEKFGLSHEDANRIFKAADMMPDYEYELRWKLLEACGLAGVLQ